MVAARREITIGPADQPIQVCGGAERHGFQIGVGARLIETVGAGKQIALDRRGIGGAAALVFAAKGWPYSSFSVSNAKGMSVLVNSDTRSPPPNSV